MEKMPSKLDKALRGVIQEDEKVLEWIEGLRGQGAVLTDRRVIVTKSGVNAGAVFGAKVTSFPFDLIAVIEVTTSGVRTALIVRSAGDRGSSDVWSSPNMVPFNRSDRERAQRFANHATEVRTSGKPRAEATASVADELVKLASLRDAGVLSEDEFAAQKAKLLS